MRECQYKNEFEIEETKCQYTEIDGVKYCIDKETGETWEVFSDKSSSGKERPWRRHKIDNEKLAVYYHTLANQREDGEYWYKKAVRLNNCSTYLACKGKKVVKIESCYIRLCPVCAWRRSKKIYSHTKKILEKMEEENKYSYLLLTLTVPNVKADKLNKTIDEMMSAWNRLQTYKRYKTAVVGWYRALEICHNVNRYSKSYDSYHPHFHCIIVVNRNYFSKSCSDYISQPEWLQMWKKAMRDNSISQLNIKRIQPKDGDIVGAICETAKYTVKSNDYILPKDWKMSLAAVETLDKTLANRRLIAFGGIMKEWHQRLNLDDEIDGDLLKEGDDDTEDTDENMRVYVWHPGYQQYLRST